MQALTNSRGRATSSSQPAPPNDCIESSNSGTSSRYRFRSPITRQARSLGVVDAVDLRRAIPRVGAVAAVSMEGAAVIIALRELAGNPAPSRNSDRGDARRRVEA